MSKFRIITIFFVLIVVTMVAIFGVSRLERHLDAQVQENHLRFTGQIKNAPPLVVFTTVALGSFRGLVADVLWLRANELQDKGSYFEMVQLANWITDLQPTFAGAITYLAWNMAYNISVTCSEFAERWRWVNEGVKLMRDKAMIYSPEDPQIYQYMAWIYLHKLGNVLDDANQYYKIRLAQQMANIVGLEPDLEKLTSAPCCKEQFESRLGTKELWQIRPPCSEEAFMKMYPPDSPFWKAATAEGLTDYNMLYEAFKSSQPGALPEGLKLRLAEDQELLAAVENHLATMYLYDTLKMNVFLMKALNERYGNFDWRFPESQAIYWATLGSAVSPGGHDMHCDKAVGQSLVNLFKSGRMLLLDENDLRTIVSRPNLDLIDAVYERLEYEHWGYKQESDMPSTMRAKKLYFLEDAVLTLYQHGRKKKAMEYYKIMQQEEPKKFPYQLDVFIQQAWTKEAQRASLKEAQDILSGLIGEGVRYLINGDDDTALSYERMARFFYTKYQGHRGQFERLTLPPYNELKGAVIADLKRGLSPEAQHRLDVRVAEERAAVLDEQSKAKADEEEDILFP